MKIILLTGESLEVDCDPADLWTVYKLMREGKLKVYEMLVGHGIDAKTFEDIILDNYRESMVPHDTLPPTTARTGETLPEMAVIHR